MKELNILEARMKELEITSKRNQAGFENSTNKHNLN